MMRSLFLVFAACWFAICLPAQAQTATVEALIRKAVAEGRATVKLPAGMVRLERSLQLSKLRHLVIDGTGTTLVCADWKNWALRLDDCADVTLRGVTIDYDPLPFTQGTITAQADDGKWLELAIHEGYPDLNDDLLKATAHAFEPKETRWKADAPDLYPKKITAVNVRHARLEMSAKATETLKRGDRLVLNVRSTGAIKFTQCEDVRVEGVTILAGPGIGILCRYMRGENRFSFDVKPGPTPAGATEPRLFSSNADAFNYAYARRGPVLENAHFSFMGDDSVNFHGPTFIVAEQISDREIIVGWKYAKEFLPWLIEPGDTVRRLKPVNYAILGEAKIESFTPERDPEPRWLETVKQHWPRATEARAVFRVKLSEPLQVEPGDALDVPEINAPGYRVAHCEFRDHRARGIRTQSSQGVIEDNVFERIKMNAITLGPEYGFWREAGWVSDVTVRRNRITEVALAPGLPPNLAAVMAVFGHADQPLPFGPGERGNERIVFEQNTIEGCTVEALKVEYGREVEWR